MIQKTLRIILLMTVILTMGLWFTPAAFAQDKLSEGVVNFEEVTDTTFDQLNPLKTTGSEQAEALSTPGGILSRVLLFAFPIAGLILFVMILWGGFEMLLGASDKKSLDAGRQRITAAIIGFLLLFVSFWIIRVVETVFGIKVLF